MERIINKMLEEIKSGRYQVTESGCVVTEYGWIYEDMAHDFILKTKRGDMRRKLAKSGELVKAFKEIIK